MIRDVGKRDGGRSRGPLPLAHNFSPGEHDVICGRGKQVYQHEGNVRFRSLVAERMNEYDEAESKAEKTMIVSQIIDHVRNSDPPGGFVRFEEGAWYEVGDFVAREKVGTQFRDLLHTKYKSSTISKKNRKKSKERQQQRVQVQDRQSSGDEQMEALHHSMGSESFDSQGLHHSMGSDSFESQRLHHSAGSESFDSQQQQQPALQPQQNHYQQYDRDGASAQHRHHGERYGPQTYHLPYASHVTPQHYHYHYPPRLYPPPPPTPPSPLNRGAITPHPSMPTTPQPQRHFESSPRQEVIEPVSYEEVFSGRQELQNTPPFIDGIENLLTATPTDQNRASHNPPPNEDQGGFHGPNAPSWPDGL
eukprot:CAMPEP_0168830644 /NCGR_PEP_ID=MMETSP0727-20121128/1636_1 /TAXON_ID=265536 /ORGANISM="Amphiprora sp., Strain CCMP467" /LENGTH=361 /DNA_ID=CAMNT_0008883879 /DNA_START=66 /DNA_END=1151 /DNA_ORIENTATION=-